MKIINLLLLLTIIISCKNEENTKNQSLYLETIDSIYLPIPKDLEEQTPYNLQYIEINKKPTLIVNYDSKRLVFYDLESKNIINQLSFKYYYLVQFHYFNEDSILLYFSNTNFNSYDSTLCMSDYKGNIYKYFKTGTNPYLFSQNNKIEEDKALAISLGFNQFSLINKKLFLPLSLYSDKRSIGTEEFINNKHPLISYFNIENEKTFVNNEFFYPNLKKGDYYPKNYLDINYCISHNNNPIFMYGYSKSLYEWDLKTNHIIEHKINTSILDSIYKLSYPNSSLEFTNARVYAVNYDPYRHYYYVKYLYSEAYRFSNLILVLDEDFKTVSENINTFFRINNAIYLKDYILSWTIKNHDSLKISYIIPKFKEYDIKKVKESLENNYQKELNYKNLEKCEVSFNSDTILNSSKMITLFDKITTIKDDNFIVINVHSEDACYSCYNSVVNFFSANRKTFEKRNCYLLVSGKNTFQIELKLNSLSLNNFNKVFIDSTKAYDKYYPFVEKTPRLTIVENGEIYFDKIYNSNEINDIYYKISDYYNK